MLITLQAILQTYDERFAIQYQKQLPLSVGVFLCYEGDRGGSWSLVPDYVIRCSHLSSRAIAYCFRRPASSLSLCLRLPTSLIGMLINPELCQCPQRRSCRAQLF